jgi:hypothetical protein
VNLSRETVNEKDKKMKEKLRMPIKEQRDRAILLQCRELVEAIKAAKTTGMEESLLLQAQNLLNSMIQVQLHRKGVAGGFTPTREGGYLIVERGYALDGYGHEILILEEETCSDNRKPQHL